MDVFELWASLVNHGKNSPLQTIICDEDVRNVLEEEKEEARAIGLAEGRGFIKRTNFRFTINYIKVTLFKIKAAFFLHS